MKDKGRKMLKKFEKSDLVWLFALCPMLSAPCSLQPFLSFDHLNFEFVLDFEFPASPEYQGAVRLSGEALVV